MGKYNDRHYTDFTMALRTEYIFGDGKTDAVGTTLKKYGATKVMIVADPYVISSGLYDRVTKAIDAVGISYVLLDGIQPNPLRSNVERGMQIALEEGVDFYLGIGGGSAMDTAKAVAAAIDFNGDDWFDVLFIQHVSIQKPVKVGVIPTIAASGSEGSISVMILDDVVRHDKYGGGGPEGMARPAFAILDPRLTFTVPKGQTAAGAVDIFSHAFERYFYHEGFCALSDELCAGVMKNVMHYASIALEEPENYEARAELLLTALYAQNDITNVGHTGKRGGPHYFEGIISGKFNHTHGVGIAVVMPAWLEYVANYSEEACARVAKFAVQVMGCTVDSGSDYALAMDGCRRLRAWLRDLNMPSTLGDLGIKESDIAVMLKHPNIEADGKHHAYLNLTLEEIDEFYHTFL